MSNAFAQTVWEMHQGAGLHPLAWRVLGGPHRRIYVNQVRWAQEAGTAAELNRPGDLLTPGNRGVKVPRAYNDTVEPEAHTIDRPGPATRPSAPAAPRVSARQPIVEVTPEDVVTVYGQNPRSIHGSISHDWHQQIWNLDGGHGHAPLAFRSGSTIFVDAELWPPALRAQVGLLLQVP